MKKINLMIDNIKLLFKFGKDQHPNQSNMIIINLTKSHDYLLKNINKETLDYLENIKFNFPVSNSPNAPEMNYEENEVLDII